MPENKLIERIRAEARARRPRDSRRGAGVTRRVVLGIGDDCAVLRLGAGEEALVTTDLSVEGTHFRREWHPAGSVGHRCLARGLSDIAAMGGEPVAAFLSLGLPEGLPQKWVDEFLSGLLKLAKRHRVELAGGDVAESAAGVVADIVVVGRAPAGRALRRSGAGVGESIYVTGELGGAAAVLLELGEKDRGRERPRHASLANAHFFPEPRVAVGRWLREKKLATACIDVSDGLSTDLGHICRESGVGAVVQEDSVPRPSGGATSSLLLALHGGEDYELLFTARRPAPRTIAGVRVTRIGEIVKGRKMWLADSHGQRKELRAAGWEHFGSP